MKNLFDFQLTLSGAAITSEQSFQDLIIGNSCMSGSGTNANSCYSGSGILPQKVD